LIENGIPAKRITHSDNKGWFAFYATAEEAEQLLRTEYHEYEDSETGGIIPACDEYHIPKSIRHHIDYVSPGIKLLAPVESHHQQKRKAVAKRNKDLSERGLSHGLLQVNSQFHPDPDDLKTCDVAITPACVAALYNIPKGYHHDESNSMGIFESELQFYTQKDLDSFFTNYTHYIPNGGQQATEDLFEAGGEVNLDLMLAYPIIYPQTITLYQVDDFIVQADQLDTYTYGFNTFLDALDGVGGLSFTHLISIPPKKGKRIRL
jgi:tripeptidyl-peptidase-1